MFDKSLAFTYMIVAHSIVTFEYAVGLQRNSILIMNA